ncbi:MAG: roadblock/LC7 domain-containing protein [candidate division Zixibacteria bacterium]|jgi:predicted regulator of Ras-like GTPase activity (Roadblock/LC7/MglB family)|nr:roadblock/LC7 domain-containing protein [candidate division Zixibacteria bacterium]
MLAIKTDKYDNKLHGAIQYLAEYRGVRLAAVIDNDGLIIDHWERSGVDEEAYSPLILLMLGQINAMLQKLGEDKANMVVIKNKNSWLTVHRFDNWTLAVIADSETDDLLRVRIGQAAEMIKNHMNDKYPLLFR